jgi:hypothetical protein
MTYIGKVFELKSSSLMGMYIKYDFGAPYENILDPSGEVEKAEAHCADIVNLELQYGSLIFRALDFPFIDINTPFPPSVIGGYPNMFPGYLPLSPKD